MPTYEYACRSCGEHLEVVQSFKDEPLSTCPNCGGSLRKVFGSIGIAFKGSGFYRTDSRTSGSRPKAEKASGDAGDGAAAKSDTPARSDSPAKADGGGQSAKSGTQSAGGADKKAGSGPGSSKATSQTA